MTPAMDRPAAVRRALRDLVADRGFHGASMGAVAKEAGVATGTAYTHYESKDELVYATYLEIKAGLGDAVLEGFDPDGTPQEKWSHFLTTAYDFLSEEPERAGFLSQLEESPYYEEAHARHKASGDALSEAFQTEELQTLLVDLPEPVIYALTFGVLVRLIAGGVQLKDDELDTLVEATWRAVVLP